MQTYEMLELIYLVICKLPNKVLQHVCVNKKPFQVNIVDIIVFLCEIQWWARNHIKGNKIKKLENLPKK
jgi:hypothetical protein